MGANIALNLADSGNRVAVYNRTHALTEQFIHGEAEEKDIVASGSYHELAGLLSKPRIVLLMIKAGPPVDSVIGELIEVLDEGDIIIDGGNSRYTDTARRHEELSVRVSASSEWVCPEERKGPDTARL